MENSTKESIKRLSNNEGIKGLAGAAALEGINTVSSDFHSFYNAEIGDLTNTVSGAVDGVLDRTGISNLLTSNPLIAQGATGLGAMVLSNKVLKDLGLKGKEGEKLGAKNVIRYTLNSAAAVTGLTVGSAALPYILGGSITYWAGKHGWKFGKEIANRGLGTIWGLTGGAVKGALKGAKSGLKGEQFKGEGSEKINPKIA
ncbi:hypothetical protein CSB08_01160 [Candidatus Gracilibacteria bacterium]|nr:MAG: hypothetical protein CSB08_01160 [Candidatus Gracilibacteria bacterium]PIE85579.1 MAG: hypothetical protein CSA08_01235 [Candidatus Gracilibacteria bacterium]